MYVITGASGNTGSKIAEKLLAENKKVRVVARNAEKLKALADKGAEVATGDLEDAAFVKQALEGAEAAYLMIPPHFTAEDFRGYQNKVADNLAEGLKANKTPYAVFLSSMGAHLQEGAGVVQGLADAEAKFSQLPDTNVRALRPTFFMENFYGQIEPIKQYDMMAMGISGDKPLPLVHTRDIAERAAERLLKLDFQGKGHEYILGPKDYTLNEAAEAIGSKIGKSIKYVKADNQQLRDSFKHMGASDSMTEAYVEFSKAADEGRISEDARRDAQNTTPTTLEQFAEEMSFALKG